MKDRFNIVFDDILDGGIDDMASIGQDIFDKWYDGGFVRGMEKANSDMIVTLVLEGCAIDKAIKTAKIPDNRVGFVKDEVLKG